MQVAGPSSLQFAICTLHFAMLASSSSSPPASAAAKDPKVQKAVTKGLDWVANSQSKLGHWTANEGRYPTAMTALAGMALLCRRLDDHARQVRREHPPRRRLPRPPQPAERPDRRSAARRSLHLRPRLLDAVSLAGAGRGGGRGPPRGAGRRADARREVHRPGADATPAAGATSAPRTAAASTKARPRSRRCRACAAAATRAFPCPRRSSTRPSTTSSNCTLPDGGVQYSSKGGGGRPAITAAAIACLFNAGEYDDDFVPKLMNYCEQEPRPEHLATSFGHWHYAHFYYAQVQYREGGRDLGELSRRDRAKLLREATEVKLGDDGVAGSKATSARSTRPR